jgi:hypothetical protein
MLPYVPDAAMALRISYDLPLGAILVALLLAALAIGIVVETHVVGTLGSRLGRRGALGRGRVATAAPRG